MFISFYVVTLWFFLHWFILGEELLTKKYIISLKKPQYRVFFLYVFSSIQTEYEDLSYKTPYLVGIRENKDLKKVFLLIFFTQNHNFWKIKHKQRFWVPYAFKPSVKASIINDVFIRWRFQIFIMQRICERWPLSQKKEGLEIPEIRAIKILSLDKNMQL